MQRAEKDHAAPPSIATLAFRRALRDSVRLVDQIVENGLRAFSVFMKILGPCLICVALSIISFVTYTFFVFALPDFEAGGLPGQVALSCTGLLLLSNTLYNYGKSIFMDPGLPPEYDKVRADAGAEAEELGEPAPRQCTRCSRLKPSRAHHCRICRRCVLKMDHHCPWINNCVGFRNYRHFCLFLLFLAASCAFVIVCFANTFAELMVFNRPPRGGSMIGRQCIVTSFMICCSILIALSILGGFHVYLVLTNQTTIEFQANLTRRRELRKNGEYFRNPYDLGRTRNFQQVFGPNPFCRFWWLLPWAVPPSGDGIQFPSISRLRT